MKLTSSIPQNALNSIFNKIKNIFGLKSILTLLIFLVSCKKDFHNSNDLKSVDLNTHNNVADIFKPINPNDLQTIIKNQEAKNAELMLNKTANKLADYFFQKEGIDLKKEFEGNNNLIIIFALLKAKQEQKSAQIIDKENFSLNSSIVNITPQDSISEDNMGCFMTAVGTIIGIADANAIWTSIAAGASSKSIIAALRLIGKRVAFAVTTAFAIYNVGECLGWWKDVSNQNIGKPDIKLTSETPHIYNPRAIDSIIINKKIKL